MPPSVPLMEEPVVVSGVVMEAYCRWRVERERGIVVFERVLRRNGVVRGVRRREGRRMGGMVVGCCEERGERRGAREVVG